MHRLTVKATGTDQHAGDAADPGKHRGLDEELLQDRLAASSDRLADPDLASSLGNGNQHDVHDSDAADQQCDRRDRGEEQGKDVGHLGVLPQEFQVGADVEVFLLGIADPVLIQQHPGYLAHGGWDSGLVDGLHDDLIDVVLPAHQVVTRRADRHDHDVVHLAVGDQHPGYLEVLPADPNRLAECGHTVTVEELLHGFVAEHDDPVAGPHIGPGEESARRHGPVICRQEVRSGAKYAAPPQ